MHFVIIFGPPAVGKMTVGYELAHLTQFRLFHNHMTIDFVQPIFPRGQPQFARLVGEFRRRIFEEVAASDLPGLIFTYVWALDNPHDKTTIDDYCTIFRKHGGHVYFVELVAPQAERLKRNRTAFRLHHKPSKRDIAQSERNLLVIDLEKKVNSTGDFFYQQNYLRLDTTMFSARTAAEQIIATFGFSVIPEYDGSGL